MAHHGEIKMLTEVVGQGEVQMCLTTNPEQEECSEESTSTGLITPGPGAAELGRRLLAAAATGDTEGIKELITLGAPFVSDWLGVSPLHAAAAGGHLSATQGLLAAGMSRDLRTKTERTALHMATAAGHQSIVRALLDAGASVDCRDMVRMTPLHWAAYRGHTAVAQELCEAGACARVVCRFLCTPLQLAMRTHPDKVELHALLERQEAEVGKTKKLIKEEEIVQDITEVSDDATEIMDSNEEVTEQQLVDDENAAELLKAHGITLLPTDEGNTVITALQNGRTVVLSDAGKIMLKESSEPPTAAKSEVTSPQMTSPIQTLTQVKYVQLPKDAKIIPLVTTGRPLSRTIQPQKTKPRSVKILLNKNHFGKLVAAAGTDKAPSTAISASAVSRAPASIGNIASSSSAKSADGAAATNSPPPAVVRVPEQFLQSTDPEYLRKQLLAAHAGLARLKYQLKKLQTNT